MPSETILHGNQEHDRTILLDGIPMSDSEPEAVMTEKWVWVMELLGYPHGNGYVLRLKSPLIQAASVLIYFKKINQDAVSYFLKDDTGLNVAYLSKKYHVIEGFETS